MSHRYGHFFLDFIPLTVQCWTWLSSTCRGSRRCRSETSLWTSSSRSGTWLCSSSPERAAWSWQSLRLTLTWPTLTLSNWQRTSIHRVRKGHIMCISLKSLAEVEISWPGRESGTVAIISMNNTNEWTQYPSSKGTCRRAVERGMRAFEAWKMWPEHQISINCRVRAQCLTLSIDLSECGNIISLQGLIRCLIIIRNKGLRGGEIRG